MWGYEPFVPGVTRVGALQPCWIADKDWQEYRIVMSTSGGSRRPALRKMSSSGPTSALGFVGTRGLVDPWTSMSWDDAEVGGDLTCESGRG